MARIPRDQSSDATLSCSCNPHRYIVAARERGEYDRRAALLAVAFLFLLAAPAFGASWSSGFEADPGAEGWGVQGGYLGVRSSPTASPTGDAWERVCGDGQAPEGNCYFRGWTTGAGRAYPWIIHAPSAGFDTLPDLSGPLTSHWLQYVEEIRGSSGWFNVGGWSSNPLGDWTPFINLAEVRWGGSFTELGHSIRGNGTVGGALPRGRWFRVTAYYDHPRFVLWIDGHLVWDGEASAQIQMNAFHWGAYSGDGADGIVRNDDIQLCTGTKNLALGEPSCSGPGPPPPPPDDVCDAADITSDGVVGMRDFIQTLHCWDSPPPADEVCDAADTTSDGIVGMRDFIQTQGCWD